MDPFGGCPTTCLFAFFCIKSLKLRLLRSFLVRIRLFTQTLGKSPLLRGTNTNIFACFFHFNISTKYHKVVTFPVRFQLADAAVVRVSNLAAASGDPLELPQEAARQEQARGVLPEPVPDLPGVRR